MELVIDQYILGTFFVSLIGFLLFFVLRSADKRKSKKKTVSARLQNGNFRGSASNRDSSPENGSSTDVIIVGAGVAGAAMANALGKDGRRVHVIERDLTEPDRIVGELLQPGGYMKLVELGIEDCVEEIDASRVVGYALFKGGKRLNMSYPLEKFPPNVAGRSFHNGRFIQKMREKAATLPNVRLEQGTVTSLLEENGTIKGVQYKTQDGQELQAYAPLTVVCDGNFSNLRRSLCKAKVQVTSHCVAIILENCELPFENHGHVIFEDPSPLAFYRISKTEVRCLIDVPGQKIPSVANGEMANYLKTMVAPQVPIELRDSFIAAAEKKGNIRSMPNRSMPADPKHTPGAILLGDAFNMRHPATGGGMTVCLSDVVVLRNLLRPLHDFHDQASLSKYLESYYTLRKPVASIINTLADALYKVYSPSPDEAIKELREACFTFACLGDYCSSGLMALLSGLKPSPLSLVLYIYAMSIYMVGRFLLPFPSPKRIWTAVRVISCAFGIFVPVIKAQGVRQTFFPATVPAVYRAPPVD